jgi:2-polyprenyl-6-methoxyphenol hydroxylase-like FAD-dependent oxidoreductase
MTHDVSDAPGPDIEPVVDTATTSCCVVGGGPGGLMLALLLARRGVPVCLLEAHATFERDFRGDSLHPGILEVLDEIGLADRLHDLPHVKMHGPTFPTRDGPFMPFDFRRLLATRFPYILWMPQHVFLEFLAREARAYPSFQLVMGAAVQRLVEVDGAVGGVRYRGEEGWHEVRSALTVGADGRFSRVRKLSGLEPRSTSAPVELLWFRLPRTDDEPTGTGIASPRFGHRQALILIDRSDHWQVGYFFPAGEYARLREAGVEAMRKNILALEPRFAAAVDTLTEWRQFSLLSVASSRCPTWYKPGLLLIGDAAHTMTPFAGAGIKYAIEDAVVAANLLADPLRSGRLTTADLARVQRKREWPTRVIQALGAFMLRQFARTLARGRSPVPPWLIRGLFRVPQFSRLFARQIAFGFWRVHVQNE